MKPSRVLLFIAACLCLLAMLCVVLPHRVQVGSRTLRWPTLGEAIGAVSSQPSEVCIPPDTIAATDTLPTVQEKTEEKPVVPTVRVDSTTDSRVFLSAFYATLAEASTRAIRVVHYGDSQIEEDRITTEIRKHLQARYGGAGVGLMPLAQTIPNRSVKQQLFMSGRRVAALQGPRRYMVYALRQDQRQDGLYGPMGQVCWMADSLVRGSEEITTVCTPTDGAPYTRWRVLADTSVHYTHHGDTMHLQGRGAVYGLSQESNTGIIVDNIPMRGCLGLVFTKIDAGQLSRFYSEANVHLIIMQFGGNAIPFNEHPGTIQGIVKGLRDQVRYIKACAPEASILFVGPSDMLTQIDGEWQTYPMVPYMDRLLRKMALEEEIAYFSLYRWMGGSGSMLRWQEVGLATSDGVHFLRSGARKTGNAIAEWLLEGNPN